MIRDIFIRRFACYRNNKWTILFRLIMIGLELFLGLSLALFVMVFCSGFNMMLDATGDGIMYLMPVDRQYRKRLMFTKAGLAAADSVLILLVSLFNPYRIGWMGDIISIYDLGDNVFCIIFPVIVSIMFFFNINIGREVNNSKSPDLYTSKRKLGFLLRQLFSFVAVYMEWMAGAGKGPDNEMDGVGSVILAIVAILMVTVGLVCKIREYEIGDYADITVSGQNPQN